MWRCDDGTRVVQNVSRGSRRVAPRRGPGVGERPAEGGAGAVAADAQGDGREAERGGGLGRPLAEGVAHGDLALAGRQGRSAPATAPPSSRPRACSYGSSARGAESCSRGCAAAGRRPLASRRASLRAITDSQAETSPGDRGGSRRGPEPRLLDGVVGVVAVAEDERAEAPQAGVVARPRGSSSAAWSPSRAASARRTSMSGAGRVDACRRLTPRPRPRRPWRGRERCGAGEPQAHPGAAPGAADLELVGERAHDDEPAAVVARGGRCGRDPEWRPRAGAPPVGHQDLGRAGSGGDRGRDLDRRAGHATVLDRVGQGLVDREDGELHPLQAPAGVRSVPAHRVATRWRGRRARGEAEQRGRWWRSGAVRASSAPCPT